MHRDRRSAIPAGLSCGLIAGFLLSAAGCQAPPQEPILATELNSGLSYIAWEGLDPHAVPYQAAAARAPRNGVLVRPGMRIVFNFLPLAAPGDNISIHAPGRYEWICPVEGESSTEDWFLLTHLLAMGEQSRAEDGSDAWARYQALGSQWYGNSEQGDAAFYDGFARAALVPLNQLVLAVHRESPFSAAPGTAAWVREWLTRPGRADFAQAVPGRVPLPSRELVLQFQDVEIKSWGWNWPFFRDETFDAPPPAWSSSWFDPEYPENLPRGFPELEVAVRFADSPRSEFVPVYWSIADLQRRYGVEIVALRRRAGHLVHHPDDGVPADALIASDGYFTLRFDNVGTGYGARQVVRLEPGARSELLVAHGDVVIPGPRLSPSDQPGTR